MIHNLFVIHNNKDIAGSMVKAVRIFRRNFTLYGRMCAVFSLENRLSLAVHSRLRTVLFDLGCGAKRDNCRKIDECFFHYYVVADIDFEHVLKLPCSIFLLIFSFFFL
jgi:hypothetical protein